MSEETRPLAELIAMLSSVTVEEGMTVFNHSAEEVGLEVMEQHEAVLAAITAAPASLELREDPVHIAARELIEGLTSTYKARNGREVGIQADDGEKCWIVHSDLVFALEQALAPLPEAAP